MEAARPKCDTITCELGSLANNDYGIRQQSNRDFFRQRGPVGIFSRRKVVPGRGANRLREQLGAGSEGGSLEDTPLSGKTVFDDRNPSLLKG